MSLMIDYGPLRRSTGITLVSVVTDVAASYRRLGGPARLGECVSAHENQHDREHPQQEQLLHFVPPQIRPSACESRSSNLLTPPAAVIAEALRCKSPQSGCLCR